jgi:hypothetical protein
LKHKNDAISAEKRRAMQKVQVEFCDCRVFGANATSVLAASRLFWAAGPFDLDQGGLS